MTEQRSNRECSQVRMVDTISQPGCAECGAGGLVLTDYRPYAFLQALFGQIDHEIKWKFPIMDRRQ